MEELAKRVKKKDEGVIRHFHLYHHHCASVTSAFRISVGYVARRSERRFDKRMDRYMYERTTAVKEKVNAGKSTREEAAGRKRRTVENEEDGAHAYVHACSHRVDEDEEERRKRGRRMIGENVGNDGKGRAGMKSEEKNETFRRSRAMGRRLVSLLLFSLSFLPSHLSLPRTLACSSTSLLLLHIHDFILCSAWRKRANVAEPRTADFLRSRSHLWRDNLVPKSRCRWSWISTSLAGKRVK